MVMESKSVQVKLAHLEVSIYIVIQHKISKSHEIFPYRSVQTKYKTEMSVGITVV